MLFNNWQRSGLSSVKLAMYSPDFSTEAVWKLSRKFSQRKKTHKKNQVGRRMTFDLPKRLRVVLCSCLEVVHSRIFEVKKADLAGIKPPSFCSVSLSLCIMRLRGNSAVPCARQPLGNPTALHWCILVENWMKALVQLLSTGPMW